MGKNIINELLRRPIAYQAILAKATGSVQLAVLWSQLYYWSDKGEDPDGWIYKSSDELYDETGLKRRGQETARKLGKSIGIVEEKKTGVPATIHFRVDLDKTAEVIETYLAGKKVEKKKVAKTKTATKKKATKKPPTKTDGALINMVMEEFKVVNPSYERLFAQSPQRQALDRMIVKFGVEDVKRMVQYLPKVNGAKYSGISITTPYQLEGNLGKLKAWGDKQKAEAQTKGKAVVVA